MARITFFSLALLQAVVFAYTPCRIQCPNYPAPSGLSDDSTFEEVIANVSGTIEDATKESKLLLTDLKANETSYSIAIFNGESTLFTYHHTADALALAPESVSEVNGMSS